MNMDQPTSNKNEEIMREKKDDGKGKCKDIAGGSELMEIISKTNDENQQNKKMTNW